MSTVAVNRKAIGTVETGVRTRRRSRAKARMGTMILTRTVVFLGITVGAYFGSSISGHIMIDQARRDGNTAHGRFNTAQRALSGLERRVRELKSSNAVETWALANGYEQKELIPGLEAPREGTIVAQRD
jgi:hypothetical protein